MNKVLQSFLQWLLEYPALKQFIQAQLQTTKRVTGFRHCICFRKNEISTKATRKICLQGTSRQVPGYSGKLSRCKSLLSSTKLSMRRCAHLQSGQGRQDGRSTMEFPSGFRRSLGVVLSVRGPMAQTLSQTEDSCWVQRQAHRGLTFNSTGVTASHPSGETRMMVLLLHSTL